MTGALLVRNARLKSLFITPAIVLTGALLPMSLLMVVIGSGDKLAWFGAALASAPLPLLIGQLMLKPTARTSEFLPLHLLLMLVGLVMAGRTMYGDFVTSWELYREFLSAIVAAFNVSTGSAPALVAIVASVIFLLYLFWYSRYGRYPDARIDVGSKLPEFDVQDLDGNAVRSTEFIGAPTVFLFYRGNWCPLCMAQIDELVERYQAMEELGITVCLISSQSDAHSKALADKLAVPFRFLVDKDNRAAEALDIAVRNGVPLGIPGNFEPETVMPTLLVTSANGTIIFSDQTDNYRVRPEPDIFLAILRRAGAVRA
jgi:peroxiredoxin/uncharacterized membrane protein